MFSPAPAILSPHPLRRPRHRRHAYYVCLFETISSDTRLQPHATAKARATPFIPRCHALRQGTSQVYLRLSKTLYHARHGCVVGRLLRSFTPLLPTTTVVDGQVLHLCQLYPPRLQGHRARGCDMGHARPRGGVRQPHAQTHTLRMGRPLAGGAQNWDYRRPTSSVQARRMFCVA